MKLNYEKILIDLNSQSIILLGLLLLVLPSYGANY